METSSVEQVLQYVREKDAICLYFLQDMNIVFSFRYNSDLYKDCICNNLMSPKEVLFHGTIEIVIKHVNSWNMAFYIVYIPRDFVHNFTDM